jgi:hypothetical protein
MARNKGTFNFAANYEVLTVAPLDARIVVDNKADLINPAIWQDISNIVWLYDGIVVSVVSDPFISNKGLYFLIDKNNYTDYNSWLKVNMIGSIDASGTISTTFQLNNGDNGVMLKDASGNLELVKFDGSTYANLKAGHLDVNTIKLDNLNGILYAVDGSIFAATGTYALLAYQANIYGNNITQAFEIDHSLNTLRQNITIYDDNNNVIYPDIERGLNKDIIIFNKAIQSGINYDIVILGF